MDKWEMSVSIPEEMTILNGVFTTVGPLNRCHLYKPCLRGGQQGYRTCKCTSPQQNGGFLSHRGTSQSSSIYRWIFQYKPSSDKGVPPWLWKTLQMIRETLRNIESIAVRSLEISSAISRFTVSPLVLSPKTILNTTQKPQWMFGNTQNGGVQYEHGWE